METHRSVRALSGLALVAVVSLTTTLSASAMTGQGPSLTPVTVPAISSTGYTLIHTFYGGGGAMSGGSYTVAGNPGGTAVGQMSGGSYRSQSGFLTEIVNSLPIVSRWFIPLAGQASFLDLTNKIR